MLGLRINSPGLPGLVIAQFCTSATDAPLVVVVVTVNTADDPTVDTLLRGGPPPPGAGGHTALIETLMLNGAVVDTTGARYTQAT